MVRSYELELLVINGMIKKKREQGKTDRKHVDKQITRLNVGLKIAVKLKETRNRNAWKVMIAYS